MLTKKELWLIEDLPTDEASDLLMIPEIKQHIVHEPHDEELGLRSLLERPDTLSKAWWPEEHTDTRRGASKRAKRHSAVLRAA